MVDLHCAGRLGRGGAVGTLGGVTRRVFLFFHSASAGMVCVWWHGVRLWAWCAAVGMVCGWWHGVRQRLRVRACTRCGVVGVDFDTRDLLISGLCANI